MKSLQFLLNVSSAFVINNILIVIKCISDGFAIVSVRSHRWNCYVIVHSFKRKYHLSLVIEGPCQSISIVPRTEGQVSAFLSK